MKIFFCVLMITFLLSCSVKKFTNENLAFELRLAETEPDINLKEMVFYNTDQKYFVYDSVYLTNSDITSTEVIDLQTQPKVQVTLNEAGRKKFADFTGENVGKNAAMIVDGKLISAPRINAQITKGLLLIVGYFDQEEAQKMATGILPEN